MKDKEVARSEWIEMIEKSWTWKRLTEKERDRFLNVINSDHAAPKGSYKERWEYCNLMYQSFLAGTDYEPIGWRESGTETPQF